MMQTRFSCKHALVGTAVCAAVLAGVSAPTWARSLYMQVRPLHALHSLVRLADDGNDGSSNSNSSSSSNGSDSSNGDGGDDKTAATIKPADVTELMGKEISYKTRNDYVTTNRPHESGKMFVLYNVGAKKFLNVGSYWGTHAALSNVPRLFWLQRRNEKAVSPTWGYLRYPETAGTSEGSFSKNFFGLTTMQVGSLERSKQNDGTTDKTTAPHAVYNYVQYVAPNGTVTDIFPKDTEAGDDKQLGSVTLNDVDLLGGGVIKAQIDMSNCQGNGSSTDGKTHMETLLSFGADIAHWMYNGMAQNNLHIFGFKDATGRHVRVCPIDASYSDATHKSGGTENKIDIKSDNLVTIEIGVKNGKRYLTVNGVDCMPRVVEDKTSPIAALFGLGKIQAGSMEGKTRSNSLYDYVRIVTAQDQTIADADVVKPGSRYTDNIKFYKQYSGNLSQWQVAADLDLSQCTGTDENVLSVGTDIANWASETGYNLHFYYTEGKTIKVNTAKGKSGSTANPYKDHKNNAVAIADPRHVSLLIDNEGVHVDGTLVSGFDPSGDAVVNYLLNTATSLQVGSRQGTCSHAVYRSLKVAKAKRVFPDDTDVWDKTPFMKTLDGNLKQWEIEVKMDLSKCTSGSSNENVLSIGTGIAYWYTDKKTNYDNLHLYYTPNGNELELDAVNSNNQSGNNSSGKKTTRHPADNTNVTIKLNKNGLYLDGELIYDATNGIVANLLSSATTALQVGSKEGNGSDALYKSFSFTEQTVDPEPTFPVAGKAWGGDTFSTSVTGNLADNPIEATIDLSSCVGEKENVLSIGTDIKNWGNDSKDDAHANNIHFYCTKDKDNVNLDVVSNDISNDISNTKYTKYTPTISDNTLTVKLTRDGLWVNGKQITGTVLSHVIDYLSTTATAMQVGSLQGTTRSHATYTTLTAGGTSLLGEAQASAKTALFADESGTTATTTTASTLTVEAQSVPAAQQYWTADDWQGNGTAKFGSESYNIAFDSGDCVEARVDLSAAKLTNENVLSVGDGIGEWFKDSDGNTYTNLHLYYAGTDADGDITMSAAFVNTANNNGLKRAFSVSSADKTMKLKLSKEGLVINGHDIFASTDTIPYIGYNKDWAGDIVRFKWDATKNQFVHNDEGTLIEVKPTDADYDDHDKARGTKVSIATGYIYTDDAQYTDESQATKVLPLFMSSKFTQETTASGNEDVFFSWAPRLTNSDRKWGNVGLFADRALPQAEITATESLNCSQWFFEPAKPTANPDEAGHNLYRIYLKMSDVQNTVRTGTTNHYEMEWATTEGQHNYYLQATNDNVYGNSLEDYYQQIDTPDPTLVDAVADDPGSNDMGLWKVIDIAEYNELFGSEKSEMTMLLDLSYMLNDPGFSRENPNLQNWQTDGGLDGHLRVGYDYYSKKKLTDTDYTDEQGKRDKRSNGSYTEMGSNQYSAVSARTNNHARFMGLDVRNNTATGRLYQDVKVTNAGWYAVSCSGLSNAGATLFVQVVDNDDDTKVSTPVEMPLHVLTDAELEGFNAPTKGWPFDKVDDTHPMPMYNALVAMNDRNVEDGTVPDRYTSQVAFFVDEQVLAKRDGSMKLRLGIIVPGSGDDATTAGSGTSAQADDGTATVADTRTDEDATIKSTDRWTLVDEFHLLFGGKSQEPHLILDEDRTSLDYLDRSAHLFDARPMRLRRTFHEGWNTIILPVNLSTSDFEKLFGKMAPGASAAGSKLAALKSLTKNTIEFESVKEDENKVLLHAFKPYIIKVDSEHLHGNGYNDNGEEYVAQLARRSNTAQFDTVKVMGDHFFLDVATLEGKHYDSETQQYYYDFAGDTKKEAGTVLTFDNSTAYAAGKMMYTYRDNTLASRTDPDDTDGKLGLTGLRAYGTLCKNYRKDPDTGKNVFMPDTDDGVPYPKLKGGYVMSGGNMHLVQGTYGGYGTWGLRCWFMPEDGSQLSAETKVMIDGVVDGTTSIADIYGDTGAQVQPRFADGVFTIDGRKLREGTSLTGLPAGIYIVNGRKTAVGM